MASITKEGWQNLQSQFVKTFPIDSLKTLPIEKYTNLNKSDSFCFWLESKTSDLGSIWGGSAYKFGIFKYDKQPKDKTNSSDDQYAWYEKLGTTRGTAYNKVIEGLYTIARAAAKGDFKAIENNTIYGEVCKWKIAFLYSGMKLIPIYNKAMLRKLANYYEMPNSSTASMIELQNYMVKKKGNKDLYDFYNELLAVYETLIADGNVWMIMGDADTLKKPVIEMGDSVSSGLKDYSSYTTKEELGNKFREIKGNTDVRVPFAYWQFIKDVKIGDVVVVFSNKKMIGKNSHILYGWGVISSDLINDIESENPLQRKVEWKEILKETAWDTKTRNSLFFHGTTKDQAEHIKQLLAITENKKPIETMESLQKYINLLIDNHNLVLTGAPGTGKTYLAKEIAKAMGCTKEEMCFIQFHPSYDYTDFVEGLRPVNINDGQIAFERKDGMFKKFCKIALNDNECTILKIYDSIINDLNNGSLTMETESKKIKCIDNEIKIWDKEKNELDKKHQFSKDLIIILTKEIIAKGDYKTKEISKGSIKNTYGSEIERYAIPVINELLRRYKRPSYVFIIDEINRGDLSKIFGELFFCIDPGYRGKKGLVQTQYQNMIDPNDVFANGFYIPENVYIIATMNDIDRSVESMDFAMRRRFTWYEVLPKESIEMLDKLDAYKDEAVTRMNRLNEAITDKLGSAFQIGPAYFLKLKNGDFNKLWRMNLKPLLHEYLRGMRDAENTLKIFEDKYYNTAATY